MQDSNDGLADKMVDQLVGQVQDKLVDKLIDHIFDRALKVPASHQTDMDNAMLGKGSPSSAGGAALKQPPHMPVYTQPFGVIRESIAYLGNPDEFVAERAKTLGPVFRAGLFFRPTVFVGGPENVKEFVRKERVITESSLPETFATLHTPYGLLNQAGERHKASRVALVDVFGTSKVREALPMIEERTTSFISDLAK